MWQTTTRLLIVIGRAIPFVHTLRWSDVRSLLIIYSNHCLWKLKHVLFLPYFSIFFLYCKGISRYVIHNKSCYVRLRNIFQICHSGKSFTMHVSSFVCFLSFLLCLWVFLSISWYVFHAKLVMSADVNFGLVIALYNNYFWAWKNFFNTILTWSWIPYYIQKIIQFHQLHHLG